MRFAVLLCSLALIVMAPLGAHATGIRETRPNLVYGELGGRIFVGEAATVSAGYERYLTSRVGIGAGAFGFWTAGGGLGSFPVYLSFIPVGDNHSLYLSAGATFTHYGDWTYSRGEWSWTFSAGYQYQAEGGFFVRPTVNMVDGPGDFIVVPGIAIGGSF